MPLSPNTQDLTTSGRDRAIMNDEGLDRDMDDHISMTGLSAADLQMNQEIPIDDPSQVVLHKEMFIDLMAESRDVRANVEFLDFNFAEAGRISESKQVTLHNKFPFPV